MVLGSGWHIHEDKDWDTAILEQLYLNFFDPCKSVLSAVRFGILATGK